MDTCRMRHTTSSGTRVCGCPIFTRPDGSQACSRGHDVTPAGFTRCHDLGIHAVVATAAEAGALMSSLPAGWVSEITHDGDACVLIQIRRRP